MYRRSALEMRVLILAPIGRDAELLAETVATLGIATAVARDAGELLELLDAGAGTAIIAEEVLRPAVVGQIVAWLDAQPPWSDLPCIVLTSGGRPTMENQRRAQEFQALGNFSLIERPVRPETVQSSVRFALRARARQYEIRSRQEALVQANADLEQFAHSASHDLREPLRSIGIYSDLLERGYGDRLDEKGREFLGQIHAGAKRMDSLLKDLLSYAHVSSFSDNAPEPIDALRPLQASLESLAGAIRESNAEIVMGEMPVVAMHESHLAQIFQNLIGNAIKYRKEGVRPCIEICAKRSEREWIISVRDNGIGVPPAYKEAIFGIFKRLHTASKYSGTGMGLAICQRIVERYHGRIWIESELGGGSTFFFTVPG
jgi:signal transduction histidine kinase